MRKIRGQNPEPDRAECRSFRLSGERCDVLPETRDTQAGPLSEGIRGQRKPRGFYAKMSDEELAAYAREFLKSHGISGKRELRTLDEGLYLALYKRAKANPIIMETAGFNEKRRDWGSMEDGELVRYAQSRVDERSIPSVSELKLADSGLYLALRKRGLQDEIRWKMGYGTRRDWASMADDEMVLFAKSMMEERGISGKAGLNAADAGLFAALRKRRLLGKVGFAQNMRRWSEMGDQELVRFAASFAKEKGICGRSALNAADTGLYGALQSRGLLDRLPLGRMRRECRDWFNLPDEEILRHAESVMAEKGISSKNGLAQADSGLYDILRKRGLLARIPFKTEKREPRSWSAMGDAEVVRISAAFLKESGISGKRGLQEADPGMYDVLLDRGLLESVFPDDAESGRSILEGIREALGLYQKKE